VPGHISAKLSALLKLVGTGCELDLHDRLYQLQAVVLDKIRHCLNRPAAPAIASKNSRHTFLDHFRSQQAEQRIHRREKLRVVSGAAQDQPLIPPDVSNSV
jgi:hypothetical protein